MTDRIYKSLRPRKRPKVKFCSPFGFESRVQLSPNQKPSCRKTILVVDDEPTILRLMGRFLSLDYEVTTARNAEQAARQVDSRQFGTIFTDYRMPSENGLWLLRYARKIQPRSRRVLTSSMPPAGLEKHVLSGLVEQFVPKPSTRNEILASLSQNT